jgi:phospholipase C
VTESSGHPDPIEYVIVLMLENRSFDHILGSLAQLKPVEGVNLASPGRNSYAGTTYSQTSGAPRISSEDPKHDLQDVLTQIAVGDNGIPTMSGFVQNYAQAYKQKLAPDQFGQVMQYFSLGGLPVLHELASQFTVCDHWFASLPGPTWPNRLFAMSGTSLGKVTMPGLTDPFDIHLYDQTTLFDRLNEKDIDWRVYFGDTAVSTVLLHQLLPSNLARHRLMAEFYSDLKASNLKPFTWIEPSYLPPKSNDYHPPHDVYNGETLVAQVYNALRASDAWNSSLLIVVFDEHGGLYDHVPPPPAVPPDNHRDEWTFDMLGVRVPTILISPWAANTVVHDLFDHTSILRYLSDKWGLGPLGNRAAGANSFTDAISGTLRTDTPAVITPPTGATPSQFTSVLTEHEQSMVTLSRALESAASESADVVANRAAMEATGPKGQAEAAVERVNAILTKGTLNL